MKELFDFMYGEMIFLNEKCDASRGTLEAIYSNFNCNCKEIKTKCQHCLAGAILGKYDDDSAWAKKRRFAARICK